MGKKRLAKSRTLGRPAGCFDTHRSMSESDTNPQEDYDCPSCDRAFDSYMGLCVHHSQTHGEKLRPEVECQECGELFKVVRSRKDDAMYCSAECRDAYTELECDECGSAFEVPPSRSHKRFCGEECYYEWNTGENHPNRKEPVIEECAACGETLELTPWKADRSERSFCDEDCRADWLSGWASGRFTGEDHWMYEIDPEDHPMYNGGDYSYGPGWNEDKKQAVRERDGYKCAICGTTSEEHYDEYGFALNVHHIVPAREFDDPEKCNDMDNLVTLCKPCHSEYEGLPLDVNT
jgi:endogenous inhibitor of DNA gyrase (YacG/DUF329 family)